MQAYLNKLVSMKPRVKDLGDKGYLLWIRFAGTPAGFQALTEAGYVRRQIRYWVEHYNYRSVWLCFLPYNVVTAYINTSDCSS